MSSLTKPVLVLNKVWIPIRIITVKRCLKLVFADRASIIDGEKYSVYNWDKWFTLTVRDEEDGIQCAVRKIKIPEVIVLSKYDKVHRSSLRLTKRNIYIRDKYKCQYTGKKINQKNGDIDHVIPRSQGGENTWKNMVVCTKEINRKKGNRTPAEAGLKLIRSPGKPTYNDLLLDPKINAPASWAKFLIQNK